MLPIAAVIWRSTGNGWSGFWEVVSSPQAVSALKLTLIMSTLAVLTTAVFGTIIAWVLVRDSFAGKSVVNAIIDLPFALPTIVAGLVIMALYGPRTPIDFTIGSHHFDANVTFTRGAIYVALLFVTLPFVVRTVQPVLIELDKELEDASRSLGASGFATFRRVVLPSILPGILSGVAMAFARAVGEIGAIVLIAGNLPFKTEVASIHLFHRIEQDPGGLGRGRRRAAADLVHRPARHRRRPLVRHEARAWVGCRSAFAALGYLALILIGPLAMMVLAHRRGPRRRVGRDLRSGHDRGVQADADGHGDRGRREHGVRDRLRAR